MRVGANAKQHAQIKKLHKQGVPAHIIAKTFRMTPQSLENILAHIDKRKPRKVTEAQGSTKVTELEDENAELRRRLAAFESGGGGEPGPGKEVIDDDDDDDDDDKED